MYSLLCTPIVAIPQNVVMVKECRIVSIFETGRKNTYQLNMLDAPPINVLPPEYDEIDGSTISKSIYEDDEVLSFSYPDEETEEDEDEYTIEYIDEK